MSILNNVNGMLRLSQLHSEEFHAPFPADKSELPQEVVEVDRDLRRQKIIDAAGPRIGHLGLVATDNMYVPEISERSYAAHGNGTAAYVNRARIVQKQF